MKNDTIYPIIVLDKTIQQKAIPYIMKDVLTMQAECK